MHTQENTLDELLRSAHIHYINSLGHSSSAQYSKLQLHALQSAGYGLNYQPLGQNRYRVFLTNPNTGHNYVSQDVRISPKLRRKL